MHIRALKITEADGPESTPGGTSQPPQAPENSWPPAALGSANNLDELSIPRAHQPITTSSDTTELLDYSPSEHASDIHGARGSLIREVVKRGTSFLRGAFTEDWAAIPIAFLASVPSNLFTALTVTALTQGLDSVTGGTDTAAFATLSSALAIVVGYSSYLPLYWGGMLIKERGDFVTSNGAIDREKFAEKRRVLVIDFLLHLPNDLHTICAMGVTQSGLLMTGSSDLFWSIIISQSAIDVVSALSEPFYWRAAKQASQAVSGSSLETESKTVQQPD